MQTISTKYLPATDTKPARIKATSSSGISVTISGSGEEDHVQAAKTLKDKLCWTGKMIGGHTKDGMVFVFANEVYIIE